MRSRHPRFFDHRHWEIVQVGPNKGMLGRLKDGKWEYKKKPSGRFSRQQDYDTGLSYIDYGPDYK